MCEVNRVFECSANTGRRRLFEGERLVHDGIVAKFDRVWGTSLSSGVLQIVVNPESYWTLPVFHGRLVNFAKTV